MNLKTKNTEFCKLEFAYLIEPNVPMKNDDELYAAVRSNGRAVIRPFKQHTLKLLPHQVLTPIEFEAKWRGD